MDDKLSILDFDVNGLIKLRDVLGIEEFVTPIGDDDIQLGKTVFLSRSKEYYNVKTMTELSKTREHLKTKLDRRMNKRNFVILENMLNCSVKVFFKKFELFINYNNLIYYTEMQQARKCLLEDTNNIIKLLEDKGLITVNRNLVLPTGRENSLKRFIEMDNKAAIYAFAKTLGQLDLNLSEYEVIIPGYGSSYIGPFLHEMYGMSYTNLLKSKYIKDTTIGQAKNIKNLISDARFINLRKKVLLLDDNIGTGQTVKEIKTELQEIGVNNIVTGAVQYNWRNYYRVSAGDKKDIDRFDVNELDIISPLNYAGHKLCEHSIDQLIDSGEAYIAYLKSKSYQEQGVCDLLGCMDRGLICAKRTGLTLIDDYKFASSHIPEGNLEKALNYKGNEERVISELSKTFMKALIEEVNNAIGKNKQKERLN